LTSGGISESRPVQRTSLKMRIVESDLKDCIATERDNTKDNTPIANLFGAKF